MAIDEGQRDDYLRELKNAIQKRREQLAVVKEKLQHAKLEDDAQVGLTAGENQLLADAGIVDLTSVIELTAKRDELQLLIAAIQKLADAVRAL